jgi:hypothetical protein
MVMIFKMGGVYKILALGFHVKLNLINKLLKL